jgi:hypothetical protein
MNSVVKKIVPETSGFYRFMFFTFMRLSAGKRLKQRKLLRFDVQLADHCNLNCKGCGNFSPVAPKHFLEKEIFEKDCTRLAELSGGRLEDICLFGGEPLLHPEIAEIMKIARKHFPDTDIGILTNGILLLKMNNDFWDCCRENNIKITITKYPIKIDIPAIKEKARKVLVQLEVFYENTERTFFFRPLNSAGNMNPKKNFMFCWEANRCIILKDGKLACTTASNIDFINNAIAIGGGGGVNMMNSRYAKMTISISTRQKILMRYWIFSQNPCHFVATAIFQTLLLAENGRYQKKNYWNGY